MEQTNNSVKREQNKLACSAERENHRPQGNSLKWVTAARALDGYRLHLTFNDGCERIFDCLPLIEKYELFAPLRDRAIFDRVNLDGWTVCWLDGSIDIAPEHLYEMGHAT